MHSFLVPRLRVALLCSGGVLAACAEPADLLTPDATLITPSQPGDAYSLVRSSADNEIQQIALSDDYVFLSTFSQGGVYRIPKYGGELSIVEEDADGQVVTLAASHDNVFWVHATNGAKEESRMQVRTRSAAGGATRRLANARWEGGTANYTNDLLADDHHLYMAAGYDVIAAPLDGGDAVSLSAYENESSPRFGNAPSWVPDYPALFATQCSNSELACVLVRGDFTTGRSENVADLEPGTAVAAVDDTSIYLQDAHHIWRQSKIDFSRTLLFETVGEYEYVHWYLQVDTAYVYFISYESSWLLRAVPKSGGAAVTIGASERLNRGVWRLLQDDQFLFVLIGPSDNLDAGSEVLAFPKAPPRAVLE